MLLRATIKGKKGYFAVSLEPSLDRAHALAINTKTGEASYEVLEDIRFEVNETGSFIGASIRYPGFCRECGGKS